MTTKTSYVRPKKYRMHVINVYENPLSQLYMNYTQDCWSMAYGRDEFYVARNMFYAHPGNIDVIMKNHPVKFEYIHKNKRSHTETEKAVFLSHYLAWQQVVKSEYEINLILEHDVRPIAESEGSVAIPFDELHKHDYWGFSFFTKHSNPYKGLDEDYKKFSVAGGYYISKKKAQELIDAAENNPIILQLDGWMYNEVARGIDLNRFHNCDPELPVSFSAEQYMCNHLGNTIRHSSYSDKYYYSGLNSHHVTEKNTHTHLNKKWKDSTLYRHMNTEVDEE